MEAFIGGSVIKGRHFFRSLGGANENNTRNVCVGLIVVFVLAVLYAVKTGRLSGNIAGPPKERLYSVQSNLKTSRGRQQDPLGVSISERFNDEDEASPLVAHLAENFDGGLCNVAEDGGNATTITQNRCNGTLAGDQNASDWMCRNDGYSGYNVAGVGGEHFGNLKKKNNVTRAEKMANDAYSKAFADYIKSTEGSEKFSTAQRSIYALPNNVLSPYSHIDVTQSAVNRQNANVRA